MLLNNLSAIIETEVSMQPNVLVSRAMIGHKLKVTILVGWEDTFAERERFHALPPYSKLCVRTIDDLTHFVERKDIAID